MEYRKALLSFNKFCKSKFELFQIIQTVSTKTSVFRSVREFYV